MVKGKTKRVRDPERTRAKILEVAFFEIYSHGFHGVSVDDIVAKTGLTKGAFFHHFPTKQALGYAITDETLKQMTYERWIKPLESYDNPVLGISENLRQIIESTPDEHFALGCPLNNLIQEMSAVDPIFREKLKAVLEFWISGIETHLKRARKAGYLKNGVNTRHLAEFVVMNHEGAFGMTKSFCDKKLFRTLLESLKSYLSACSSKER